MAASDPKGDGKQFSLDFDNSTSDNITKESQINNLKGGIFMTSLAGFSMLFGFGMTVAMAKRKDPAMFTKSLIGSREMPESGASLAMRALAWGTVYSVTGVGLLCFAVWKLLGVQSMTEFSGKMRSVMPEVPKHEPRGKSDFKSVQELIDYILAEDEKQKEKKKG
ncbi:hypothetical protein ScPMuIL_012103 [Solemya velum]